MCIIICKPYGKKIPLNHLQEAFKRNGDGAGVAFTTGKGVVIKKGFFTWEKFAKKCLKYNNEQFAAVFHFRITTHGGTSVGLCHPFPITTDDNDLRKPKIVHLKYAAAHNGIFRLDGLTIPTGDSDTTAFIKKHLYPIYEAREEKLQKNEDTTNYDAIIESLVSGCKFAVLGDNGYIKRYGKGWQEENGIYYSNNSYKPYQYTYYTTGYNNKTWQPQQQVKTFTRWSDWEEWDDDTDSGYYAGSYWVNGRLTTKNEYEQHKAKQQDEKQVKALKDAELAWYESLAKKEVECSD